eukprot:1758198-Amphidinium_carterae.4
MVKAGLPAASNSAKVNTFARGVPSYRRQKGYCGVCSASLNPSVRTELCIPSVPGGVSTSCTPISSRADPWTSLSGTTSGEI